MTLPKLGVEVRSRVSAFVRLISSKKRNPMPLDSTSSPQLVQGEEFVPELDYFTTMEQSSRPPRAPVPFSALFSGMQYNPSPPTPPKASSIFPVMQYDSSPPTPPESSSVFSGMQYDPSPPTPTESSSVQKNRQVPTLTLHVPQTIQYEQPVNTVVGRYRAKFETSPPGLTRRNEDFIKKMINSEVPLPTRASLAVANTRAATYYTLVTNHAATIDFGGYWPPELKDRFEFALWQNVSIMTRSGRCFNESVEISGGRTFHAWVERVPEEAGLRSERVWDAGFGARTTGGYF